jgi:hypothetical protein
MTKTTHLLLSTLLLVGSASAATITYNGSPAIPDTQTNWNNFIGVQQFNPSLGTLTSVQITLNADVNGTIGVENTSNSSSAPVTSQLSANISLKNPSNTLIVSIAPSSSIFNDNLAVYDGAINFSGPSGATHTATANQSNSAVLTSLSDLGLFTGTGSVSLPISAIATSYANDGGNLVASIQTAAGASASVTYTYTPGSAVPEPSSLGLMGLGFSAVGLLGRKFAKRG